ncbi:BD1L1 protein, partial [Panurus biarmicus]|nr:BD1L1 protein [Panurus biarmicus]
MVVRKRGRKPRRSLVQSEEMETLEPEKKRRKLTSSEDELKEQEEGEEEDGEEDDDAHSGATTRSATRLEAQRRRENSSPKFYLRSTLQHTELVPPYPIKKCVLAVSFYIMYQRWLNLVQPSEQNCVQSAKRKREDSPTVVRRKGQQKTEETPVKKAKR